MHVISRKKIREFVAAHPGTDAVALDRWFHFVKRAKWMNFAEVRADFGSADQVGGLVVFNLGGNKYRLIAKIKYSSQKVYVRAVLTHREYDRDDWMEE